MKLTNLIKKKGRVWSFKIDNEQNLKILYILG